MILRTMLQRLYATLTSGPGLNARPHRSRQRIDLMELRHLRGTDPAGVLGSLLTEPERVIEFAAKVPQFQAPNAPEDEWPEEQKAARTAFDRQARILLKLRDIVQDATDYYNDHGEQALFLGFPLLSMPAGDDRQRLKANRILAPVMFIPVNLRVRRGAGARVTIESAGQGAGLVEPNPGLLAWLEQQTGVNTENLFADETGEDPWREIAGVLSALRQGAAFPAEPAFDALAKLQSVPGSEDLPAGPALLPCAVLGLFPLVNPGLLRDTKWMMENEGALENPVKSFLSAEALAELDDENLPEAREWDHSRPEGGGRRDFSEELFITPADPCQAEAVAHARRSAALVVHGPPGTGKSQTIANIIGDHLARGERVLFVCDKRTALDVVKYRLDSMGLGSLCGVIHDPHRDRRDLYLGLRERLEKLAQEPAADDPARRLGRVNQRLNKVHAELRGYFDRLHASDGAEGSFHLLCGQWLELRKVAGVDLSGVEGATVELLQAQRTDAEEILRRGIQARWPENPFRDRLGMTLSEWLGGDPDRIRAALEAAQQAALAVDRQAAEALPVLDARIPLAGQAEARLDLGNRLEAAARQPLTEASARLADDPHRERWRNEWKQLEPEGKRLDGGLDRELVLQTQGAPPGLGECNRRALALEVWSGLMNSWRRFISFGARKAAVQALDPLALSLAPENIERARNFYLGLKARHLWADLRERLLGLEPSGLAPDESLLEWRDGLPPLFALLDALQQPVHEPVRERVLGSLKDLPGPAVELAAHLRLSARRAEAIQELESAMEATRLFTLEAMAAISLECRNNGSAAPLCARFLEFFETLEEAIRLLDRMRTLPDPLREALSEAAVHGLPWEQAEPALRAAAVAREIRRRLSEDKALARIDTQRVDAAFSELLERTSEKQELVRLRILSHWQGRWRERLLSNTGSRLNSLGAALRQRLFVRGQRAMKLRQMIAAGAGTEGGDPLFDLCPVWMASPAIVAQIFPREALFDVLVFDEASQCRLEEALPVLLRGKRVVIAGDPKQLPPTRFFEQALADSDHLAAETAGEVFVQQQSEAEDLLSAALNLNVQEAFLDVHYRSRNEALIGFSNEAFYGSRLQPIPGHPRQKAFQAPIRLLRVDGVYLERGNLAEAKAAADLVGELLDEAEPPSIGVACFNLNQRDLILDALEEKAALDRLFAERLERARTRRGRDSFEGFFVRNLENVQGDERDHIIISTTFGPDPAGKFRRNFGALSRAGGERRLNVLVTRARQMIHVLTSIPRPEYTGLETLSEGERPTGRHFLYRYLRYTEQLDETFEQWRRGIETARSGASARCDVAPAAQPSIVAEALGRQLLEEFGIGSTVHWGNEGFRVDVALTHPELPADVTVGVLVDFTRYLKTPDPIAWEHFRSLVLTSQGWRLHRVWTPSLFRDPAASTRAIRRIHLEQAGRRG